MNTPIADFLEDYEKKGMLRLHMPGHNGEAPHDITEIAGADSLYETDSSRGIIAHSEAIAAKLFGAERTCYSAGGSTLAIKAALAILRAQGCKTIAAGRCSHRSLVSSAALLGLEVKWLYPKEYPSADVDCSKEALSGADALFLTNIDYYGGTCSASDPGIPVVVDNAHGSYLKFDFRRVCAQDPPGADRRGLPALLKGRGLFPRQGNDRAFRQHKSLISRHGEPRQGKRQAAQRPRQR